MKKNNNFSRTTITVPHDLKKRMKRTGSQVNWSAIACDAFETKLEEIGPFEEITTIEATVERLKALAAEAESAESAPLEQSPAGDAAGRHWAMNLATVQQLSALEDFHTEVTPECWGDFLSTRDGWIEMTRRIADDETFGFAGPDEEPDDEPGRGRHRRGHGPGHDGPGRGRGGPGRGGPGRGGPEGRGRGRHDEGRHEEGRHDGHRRRLKGDGPGGKRRHRGGFRARAFWREILEERPSEPNFFGSFADGALAVWNEVKPQVG
ncbi:hypothetical protein SAMN06265222_10880 [Neorhodopirellula lusitana]|uniref:Uncharacterized protein n=1 Tax=Neorhodopirellula lusitana TaxID=445327 RepID=A0ABY1QC85_9BACT|nr:hypothetical protein [Neorhodopirellula lusitana]SMP63452.1 hypothetical protein SAMN06265222_10880 [Neorhodopirellula lusitana]